MSKNILLIFIFLLITSCNHTKILVKETQIKSFNYVYIEKPFEIKWNIQKKSITSIPIDIKKKIKIICKEFNRIVLIKIKTFQDNTAVGTFECRM
ncbi:hypothetical protein OAM56_02045 [Alphaproteobacteria bacterium]|nr:hypothetical protein [Alphaproteobacteria bacterium]